jgi:hypothetical protein
VVAAFAAAAPPPPGVGAGADCACANIVVGGSIHRSSSLSNIADLTVNRGTTTGAYLCDVISVVAELMVSAE